MKLLGTDNELRVHLAMMELSSNLICYQKQTQSGTPIALNFLKQLCFVVYAAAFFIFLVHRKLKSLGITALNLPHF